MNSEDIGEDFERIAGALVHAVRRSVRESVDRRLCESSSHTGLLPDRPPQQTSTGNYRSTPQALRASTETSTPETDRATSSTAYERAMLLQSNMRRDTRMNATGSESTMRRSHSLPSAFRPTKRGRKGGASGRVRPISVKPTLYQRDIICLPNSMQSTGAGRSDSNPKRKN